MRAGVLVKVDQFLRFLDGLECRLLHHLWAANKCDHRPVMIQIGVVVKHAHTLHRFQGREDRRDDLGSACVRKIRDAFNQGIGHVLPRQEFSQL